MIKQLFQAFRLLFPAKRYGGLIIALILLSAIVPVSEMLVARMFSRIIIDGSATFQSDPGTLYVQVAVFFGAFAVTRTIHHLVRWFRVKAFARAFKNSPRKTGANQESWEWALAFELTGVVTVMVQASVFAAFFLYLSLVVGAMNVAIALIVIAIVSILYRRQLVRQREYIATGKNPDSDAIASRVTSRIVDAEYGSVIASFGLVIMFGLLLFETVKGSVSNADAIVMFLGLRLMYGQLGNMSAHLMRFARAFARVMP